MNIFMQLGKNEFLKQSNAISFSNGRKHCRRILKGKKKSQTPLKAEDSHAGIIVFGMVE